MTARLLVVGVCALLAPVATRAQTFALPAGPLETITAPAPLRALARDAAVAVERALGVRPAPEGERLALLLALRVHLALLLRDGPRALEAAEQIRGRQTTEAERAFAGLTTRATVASWAAPREEQAAAFAREFRRLLVALPRAAEMRAVLVRQRERLQAMTEAALRAEAGQLAAKLGGRREVTLAEADAIVRVGHRLENLLPLRAAMIAALDEAIAAR